MYIISTKGISENWFSSAETTLLQTGCQLHMDGFQCIPAWWLPFTASKATNHLIYGNLYLWGPSCNITFSGMGKRVVNLMHLIFLSTIFSIICMGSRSWVMCRMSSNVIECIYKIAGRPEITPSNTIFKWSQHSMIGYFLSFKFMTYACKQLIRTTPGNSCQCTGSAHLRLQCLA